MRDEDISLADGGGLRRELEACRAELRALRESRSWRFTAPLRAIAHRLRGGSRPAPLTATAVSEAPPLEVERDTPFECIARFDQYEEWRAWREKQGETLAPTTSASVVGHVRRHGLTTPLFGPVLPREVGPEGSEPREGLVALGLNARQRAVLAVLASHPRVEDVWSLRLYAHEALTPFALRLRGRYARLLCSEYAADAAAERALWPVPAVDVTRSPFPDAAFDIVLSNEVLEHVPDLDAALRDTRRILATGGWLLGTVPFAWEARETDIRARLDATGRVVHLAPPEYHGNPVDPEGGSLVFQIPGWDLLDRCRSAGFRRASILFVGSARHGICSGAIPGVFVLLAEA